MTNVDRPASPVEAGVAPQDVALIIYTSGSTSRPKGVRHSHETLLYELAQSHPQWRVRDNVYFAALPFGHMAGILTACTPLVYGVPMLVLDYWDARQALQAFAKHGVTAGTLPPFHLTTILEEIEASGQAPAGLADCLTGSTSVQPALVVAADEAGFTTYRCYGSSEHPTISTGYPADPLRARSETDGHIQDGVEVRIVDDDDHESPSGSAGEILSRGPDLFLGYTDQAATAQAFTTDGFYRTGDIGFVRDGFLTVTGRRKEIIIRGGENLSPIEIEGVLAEHPLVLEAAVVGCPDEKYGERPWAFVTTRSGAELTLEDIRAHFVASGLARQKTPEGLTILEDFPRTSAGKIRRQTLKDSLTPTRAGQTEDPR